jgi:hypothetical protein
MIADGQFEDARLLLEDLLEEFPEHPALDRFRRPGRDARRIDPADDLREVDFLHEVGLDSDAAALFRELQERYPAHPALAGRTPTGTRASQAAATPNAVVSRNVTPPSGSRSVDTTAASAGPQAPPLPRTPGPGRPAAPASRPDGRSTQPEDRGAPASTRPPLPRGPFPPLPRRPRPAGQSTPTAAFRLDDLSDVLNNE